MPFSAEHLAKFRETQAMRPVVLKRFGETLGVWKGCGQKACRRNKSCERADAACLTAFMSAMDDEMRATLHCAITLMAGGVPRDQAAELAVARVGAQAKAVAAALAPDGPPLTS
jgi:hypothetical protein